MMKVDSLNESPLPHGNLSSDPLNLAARMRTFNLLKWCGMPYNVS